jgi:Flp pilus assembly protein TadG
MRAIRVSVNAWANDSGATAVEFGIIAPAFIAILLGVVCLGMLMFTQASMHYAVEESARCASVKTTVCKDAGSTQTYAQNHYYGPNIAPTFTATSVTCGNSVTASATFTLNVGIFQTSIPLSATACFP